MELYIQLVIMTDGWWVCGISHLATFISECSTLSCVEKKVSSEWLHTRQVKLVEHRTLFFLLKKGEPQKRKGGHRVAEKVEFVKLVYENLRSLVIVTNTCTLKQFVIIETKIINKCTKFWYTFLAIVSVSLKMKFKACVCIKTRAHCDVSHSIDKNPTTMSELAAEGYASSDRQTNTFNSQTQEVFRVIVTGLTTLEVFYGINSKDRIYFSYIYSTIQLYQRQQKDTIKIQLLRFYQLLGKYRTINIIPKLYYVEIKHFL